MATPVEGLAQNYLSDPNHSRLAHLPFLTLFYLYFQRQLVATPVTPLELAAYLGVEVKAAEGVLSLLESQGIVRQFKADLPAYCLTRELNEIPVLALLPVLTKFQELIPATGGPAAATSEADEKYRRLYSELASEILTLFGQSPVNQLPI